MPYIKGVGGGGIAEIQHPDGVLSIPTNAYNAWVNSHPQATPAVAETQILTYISNHLPNGYTGAVVAGCLQVRRAANPERGINLYVHVFTVSPPRIAARVTEVGVVVQDDWW